MSQILRGSGALRVSSRATLTLSVAKGKGSRGTPVPTEEPYAAHR